MIQRSGLHVVARSDSNGTAAGLRTRGVIMARVRPLEWQWRRRIPIGVPSIFVGEEAVGKGTLAAWMIARATRGELDGDRHGQPVRALIIGDEDGFEPVWVPRLHAAGADLAAVRTLDDGEYLDDLRGRSTELAAAVRRDNIGLVVLDQLLDHGSGGDHGQGVYNPQNVRSALMPLRRVCGEQGIAAVGLLHPIKGHATSFRQLMAGSHQFNAVSRSSLLLGVDPEDRSRRVLVRGKGNHSAAPRSLEFQIAADVFELNGHTFEVPKAVDVRDGDRTIDDLLKASEHGAPVRVALADALAATLTDEPQTLAALARVVGRDPKDGTVRNALAELAAAGRAQKDKKGWRTRPGPRVQGASLKGDAPAPPECPPRDDTPDGWTDEQLQAVIDAERGGK